MLDGGRLPSCNLTNRKRQFWNSILQTKRQGEIVFYGASNFRLWTELENDLADFKVQNHGFGGSTDKDLMRRADKLLYPYNPKIVVFQTGSNDYVGLPGSDDEKVEACMAYKREMFTRFHERLPEARFVIMSGLLLPGRSQYTELTQRINQELARLCEEMDYLFFVDASALTCNGETYAEELFIEDGIHLNHDGQLRWCEEYIRPVLGQHRTITSADLSGSFAPVLQFQKREIHTVFPRFRNFELAQNLSLRFLAELCGVALEWVTEEYELDYLRKEGL